MFTEDDLFARMHSIMKKMRKIADKEIFPLGITHVEMRLLMLLLVRHPEGCNQEELVPELYLDGSNVSRALKKLENLDYITRASSKEDARTNSVFLTEKGRAVKNQLLEIRSGIRETFIMGISPQELDALSELLKKVDQSLSEDNYLMIKKSKQDKPL